MFFILGVLVAIVSFLILMQSKKAEKKQEAAASMIGVAIGGTIIVFNLFTVIPAGHIGVVDFLGKVSDYTLKSGVNIVNPLATIAKFSVKTQEYKETMNVPTKEGLNIQIVISLNYSLDPDNTSKIYSSVGENYSDIILVPAFHSVVRSVASGYEARALYTVTREQISTQIKDELQGLVGPSGIRIEGAFLKQVVLPTELTASIEAKLKADQDSQQMQYVLKKEEQEAERKRIEAKGISDFQIIISKGLTQQLLQWKGIEATEKLANSPNSKVIVVGSGKNGLPIILGNN